MLLCFDCLVSLFIAVCGFGILVVWFLDLMLFQVLFVFIVWWLWLIGVMG